jgi:hypothetical protein
VSQQPEPDETFEHIPWEQLQGSPNRRILIYSVAAAVAAAGLTAAITRTAGGPTLTTPVATTLPVATAPPPEALPSTVPTTAVWTEADLMAADPADLRAEAGAFAEWFAAEFFTRDGGTPVEETLGKVLPPGTPLPAPGGLSYVEWVRAVSVTERGPGEMSAVVVVSSLGSPDGGPYRRLPPRAVEVRLRWTDGGWQILDLPSPAEVPPRVVAPAFPEGDLPSAVEAAAQAVAGPGGEVVEGGPLGEWWRVVVMTVDEVGGRWPLVVWFDGEGREVAPPAG